MAEPAFHVKKLDVVIGLLASHTALDTLNPTLIPTDEVARLIVAAVSLVGVVFLSALVGAARAKQEG